MLGIFGGSFDPIHFGHIKTALSLLDHYQFEHIKFIPCQLSPHKEHVHADARHRLHMLNIVCENHEKLSADDRELNRKAPSYTIDTLQELRGELGKQQSIALIMGIDAYLEFCAWHRYEEILSMCHIILLQRPGYNLPEKNAQQIDEEATDSACERKQYDLHMTNKVDDLITSPCGKIYMSHLEEYDVSSTQIREVIAKDEQPKYMLPGNVWNYIRRNNLYK